MFLCLCWFYSCIPDEIWVDFSYLLVRELRTNLQFVPWGLFDKSRLEGTVSVFLWVVVNACLFGFYHLWANTHGPAHFLLTRTSRLQSNLRPYFKEIEMYWITVSRLFSPVQLSLVSRSLNTKQVETHQCGVYCLPSVFFAVIQIFCLFFRSPEAEVSHSCPVNSSRNFWPGNFSLCFSSKLLL